MINDYISQLFVNDTNTREKIYEDLSAFNISANCVKPEVGKFLYLLVKSAKCERVLEIGTSGGYSTKWLAKAIPEFGELTTLEINPVLGNYTKNNLQQERLLDRVSIIVGTARDSLETIKKSGRVFDFVFIDADKINYKIYLDLALEMVQSGSLIVTDNVLWGNRILDSTIKDTNTEAIRSFNRYVAGHHRLESILLPLGDGLMISRVI